MHRANYKLGTFALNVKLSTRLPFHLNRFPRRLTDSLLASHDMHWETGGTTGRFSWRRVRSKDLDIRSEAVVGILCDTKRSSMLKNLPVDESS